MGLLIFLKKKRDEEKMQRRHKKHVFDRSILEQSEALTKLDNWRAPIGLMLDYLVIAAAISATLYAGWIVYPLAVLVIG